MKLYFKNMSTVGKYKKIITHVRANKNEYLIFVTVFLFAFIRCILAFKLGEYGVNWKDNVLLARKKLGGLDAGSYLQGAISIINGTYAHPSNAYIWDLWPPGMPLLEAFLISIIGIHAPILLVMSILDSLLIAGITLLMLKQIKKLQVTRFIGYSAIIFFLLSSATQGWLLDQGILYAETPYLFFTVLALYLVGNLEGSYNFKICLF